ncbi:predicted protein [Arabidopsis lyrata subsp. lyrata]|uniref:Predicted protein n=1 Tax=Arabidopsis lyrata subsp. lyrata TaxID=81972 RepID=D7L2K7_ARALL|nr:predicted protein [Arabidopsis lyrata subsp. lyrata]EFH61810.1 predicted protein [Arabidopsis lyrata subsp. lyrata]
MAAAEGRSKHQIWIKNTSLNRTKKRGRGRPEEDGGKKSTGETRYKRPSPSKIH